MAWDKHCEKLKDELETSWGMSLSESYLLAGALPPYPDDADELLCRDLLELPLLWLWLLLHELLYAESEIFVLCVESVPSIALSWDM